MKVKVDRDLYIGVSNCVAIDDDTLLEAAESCPENAIILEDDEGNQLYP